MSRSKIHDRRKRISRSQNTQQRVKDNKHLEHANAQASRDVNAQVLAGTYTPTSRQPGLRFAPTPQRMHFSPRQQQFLRVIVAPLMTHEETQQP